MKTYVLALDLKDDNKLIEEYEAYHKNVWPEVLSSIRESGIQDMKIYRAGTRLVMQMVVDESFSFEKKAAADEGNDKVQQWEALMWKYQEQLPGSKPSEKWILMDEIFSLT